MGDKHIYGPGGEYKGKITDEGPSSSSYDGEGCVKSCLPAIPVLVVIGFVVYWAISGIREWKVNNDRQQEQLRVQQQAAEEARHGDTTIPFAITSSWTEVPSPHDSKEYNRRNVHPPEDIDVYYRVDGAIYFAAAHQPDIKLPPSNGKLEVRTPNRGKYQATVRYYFVTQ